MNILLLLLRLFVGALLANAQIPSAFDNTIKMTSLFPPVLKVSSSEGFLPESAEMGTTVRITPSLHSDSLQILVQDGDLKPGMPPATYEYILTGLGASVFAVDQQGYVYLNVPNVDADPPNPSTYQLNVEAREVNTTPIRNSEPVSITIHIMDVNDNPPAFSSPIYTANVTASGGDRPVLEVYATDNDAGKFAQIDYKISSVTNGAYANFYYDAENRMLRANGQLTPGEHYQIVLEARDGGGLTGQTVIIALAIGELRTFGTNTLESHTELNPALPIFPGFAMTTTTTAPDFAHAGESSETIQTFVTELNEATPINSVVVSLGDEATKGKTYFVIVGGNDEGKFAIDENTGTIKTVDLFDRELTAMYSLQIEARSRNPDQHLYWTVVQVAILDINDNAPRFTDPQPIRLGVNINDVSELKPNLIIGRISVKDPDSEDNGKIILKVVPPMDKLFVINEDGLVMVNGELTQAHFGEHQLTVSASDMGEPQLETQATVIVTIGGTVLSRPATTDNYEGSNNHDKYQILPEEYTEQPIYTLSPTITDYNSVTPSSQEVFMPIVTLPSSPAPYNPPVSLSPANTLPNMETIETMDNNYSQASTLMPTTTLPSLRFAPVFDPSKITILVEENEEDTELTKLNAFYIDNLPGTVTYVMKSGDPNLFSVSSFTGSLMLLRPLDAESESTYEIEISTAEAMVLGTDPSAAHSAFITVKVADVNDWIPNFESNSYSFVVNSATVPGTIIGQVVAFDQDRDEPNNKIYYRMVNNDGLEAYFAVNAENGLITLKLEIDAFVNERITLRVEASDGGTPKQASQTTVYVDVEPAESVIIPKNLHSFTSSPEKDQIQFSLRNYTASVSEAVRPPYLVQILSVINKPADTRFIVCAIASGNYRGAFSISTGADGNCELRTQMELDRETTERHLLNVTVSAGSQTDFALVGITVLDANDNVPRFIYDNDLGLEIYFAGVASNAGAFTRVVTVKAEDADLGNSSVVMYSLDPLSVDTKFFTMGQSGEVTTKMSMTQVLQKNRQNYFEIRATACDSPITGQQLCSKADIVINVVTNVHRFITTITGMQPQKLRDHEQDIIRALRQFTGPCTLLSVEKMTEQVRENQQMQTDIYWYAVNPSTKRICKKQEFRKLFDGPSVSMVAGKLQPWLTMEKITEDIVSDYDVVEESSFLGSNFKLASIALIILAILIAIGALGGICGICICYSRYKVSQRAVHAYPNIYPMPKFGTIFLPNGPGNGSHDKIYETQMLELPISDEDFTMKGSSNHETMRSVRQSNQQQNYRSYGRSRTGAGDEGDFSIEESMYAINMPGRIDPVTKYARF